MNIIVWNCRGVGKKSFPGLIRDMKLKFSAQFVVLLETHVSGSRSRKIIKRMGFNGACLSEAEGHSGGIWCLWDTGV